LPPVGQLRALRDPLASQPSWAQPLERFREWERDLTYYGIAVRVRCQNGPNDGKYWWDVDIQSTYEARVEVTYRLEGSGEGATHLGMQEVRSLSTQLPNGPGSRIKVGILKVCRAK
jgi:hypothetical protein